MQQSNQDIEKLLEQFGGNAEALRDAINEVVATQKAEEAGLLPNSLPNVSTYVSPDAKSIISLQDVTKKYKLGKQIVEALKGVSVDIKEGEFIAITGASGSGKSTLLQIIGCLDKPTKGSVIVQNQDVTKLSDNALSNLRRKTIGFIFQSFYLQPFLKVEDNIAVPAMFTSTKKKTIDGNVQLLLEKIGLSDRSKHFPKELSGGQIQRAAIARALINTPSIILADEPTGNLDSTNSQAIIELFKTIREGLGTTIIIVTHDLAIARQADRVIQLKDGAIV